jgi:hypothetical protein
LVALTKEELKNETFGPPAGIRGVTGVGLARVDGTNEINWVFVACNELPTMMCDRHRRNQPMSLLRVRDGTARHLKGTLFFRCGVPLGGRTDRGYPRICGNNVYLAYPLQKLQNELQNQNPILRPFVIQDRKSHLHPKTIRAFFCQQDN